MAGPTPSSTRRGRLSLRRRSSVESVPAPMTGTVRLGKKTKELVKRLHRGEVAVIDHADLDRIAAEDLAASGAAVVVNVAPFSTGRYPNAGPLVLARAGVRLIEAPAAPLFEQLRDGEEVVIEGGELSRAGTVLASGRVLSVADLTEQLERQRERIDEALAAFAENTMAHVREEGELLAGKLDLPRTRTNFRDRHVLIVVRGTTYRSDLRALRAYLGDVRPLLIGVDGGADALLEDGYKPDVILGDMDSASDAALKSGAELIVHAYPDGRAPGTERLAALGLDHLRIPAPATSQDVAMLLAYEKGARLIVMVGAHFNLTEFLDKDRAGMSSTFLTRLRVGDIMVDAKGVSRLYNPGVRGRELGMFAVVSLLVISVVILTLPELSNFSELLWLKVKVLLGL